MFQNKVILISPSLHLKTNRIQFSFPEEPLATREWAREQFYSVESFFFWHIYLPELCRFLKHFAFRKKSTSFPLLRL